MDAGLDSSNSWLDQGRSGAAARAATPRSARSWILSAWSGSLWESCPRLSAARGDRAGAAQRSPILVFDGRPTRSTPIGERDTGAYPLAGGQRTVLVASHMLTEIEKVASRIMILRDGDLLTADATSEGSRAPRFRLRIVGPRQAVLAGLRDLVGVVAAEVQAASSTESADSADTATYLVETASRPRMAEDMAQSVVGNGFALAELVEQKPDLERVFLDLTRRATEAPVP